MQQNASESAPLRHTVDHETATPGAPPHPALHVLDGLGDRALRNGTLTRREFASILAEKRAGLSREVKSRWKAATRKPQHRQEVALPEATPSRPGLGCRTT